MDEQASISTLSPHSISTIQVLMMSGQTYMRPRVLTQAMQYYFLLMQKSLVAICGYAK